MVDRFIPGQFILQSLGGTDQEDFYIAAFAGCEHRPFDYLLGGIIAAHGIDCHPYPAVVSNISILHQSRALLWFPL